MQGQPRPWWHNTVKKRFTSFPSPAGMSLTKLPLGRKNSVMTSLFPPRESLVVTSRLGTGKLRSFFFTVKRLAGRDRYERDKFHFLRLHSHSIFSYEPFFPFFALLASIYVYLSPSSAFLIFLLYFPPLSAHTHSLSTPTVVLRGGERSS